MSAPTAAPRASAAGAVLRIAATAAAILLGWELLARAGAAPPYLLPRASDVLARLAGEPERFAHHALATFGVALIGLALGALAGVGAALTLVASDAARRWLLPILVASQAAPAFALAPLLTLWLGFGAAPKIVMCVLVVYFPVAASFYDGLRRLDPGLIDLARTMNATPVRALLRLRAPAALPALGSGLRLAAAFAPIAAVIGEWTGGARGLGYLMLYANARADAPLLFAALLLLGLLGVALYAAVRAATRAAAPWAPETTL